MITRNKPFYLFAFLTLALAACGGSTTGGGDGVTGGPDPTPTISPGVNLVASSNNLPSSAVAAADGVEITAIVRDQNNNVVSGQLVSFSADSGALQVTRGTTDASGTAAATLTTGGNQRNRVINISASAGSNSDSVQVQVVGTQLSLAGPGALALNDNGTFTASLTDSGGAGIANQTVTVSSANGNTLSMTNPVTDGNGQAQFMLTANNPGTDTLTASALGLTAQTTVNVAGDNFQLVSPISGMQVNLNTNQTVTLRWLNNSDPVVGQTINFATTRGTLSATSDVTGTNGEASVTITSNNAGPASITASESGGLTTNVVLQFIATQPDSIDVQGDPATVTPNGQSNITAIVRDPNNNLVTGATVNFTLDDTSGGSLRDGSVTTNTNGVAGTVYTAGSTSASEPATITATVSGTAIVDTVNITVGGQALRITLGTGNELQEPTTTTYAVPYVAIVTDAAGNPAPNANFRLSVLSVAYQKGTKQFTNNGADADPNNDNQPDAFVPGYTVGPDPDSFGMGCMNEDTNGNGVLDTGEDINNSTQLEPGNVATVPSTLPLDQNGSAEFTVTYPQNFSQWVRVRLRAIASVQGTETTSDATFILPVLASDVSNAAVAPPGQTSPFGTVGDCANPN